MMEEKNKFNESTSNSESANEKKTNEEVVFADDEWNFENSEERVINEQQRLNAEVQDDVVKENETRAYISKMEQKKYSKLNTITTNISVSVITSLLTLSIASYYDFPNITNSSNADTIISSSETNAPQQVTYANATFKSTDENTVSDIAERLAPTIVGVVNMQQVQRGFQMQTEKVETGSGSGVIFKKDGKDAFIITNNHVIENATEVTVSLNNGETTTAEIVGADALTDIAVLKISGEHVEQVAPFGNSSSIRPGDEVIAIGNPLGLDFSRTVTKGIISATNRSITVNTSAGEWELQVIQTDAAINPGNSGGALINSQGEVIGINSLKISQEGVEGLGFAIPSEDVLPVAEELINHGTIKRPYLGIQLYNVADIAPFYRQNIVGSLQEGIIVTTVEKFSPAAQAGLEENDVIVSVNGEKVTSTSDFKKYLYKHIKPGDAVDVTVYRDGKKQTITIKTIGK